MPDKTPPWTKLEETETSEIFLELAKRNAAVLVAWADHDGDHDLWFGARADDDQAMPAMALGLGAYACRKLYEFMHGVDLDEGGGEG